MDLTEQLEEVKERIAWRTDGITHWPGCEEKHLLCAVIRAIEALEKNGAALAANQCDEGYGDDHGHHQCGYRDQRVKCQEYLSGFMWLLKEGALVRDIEDDDSPDFHTQAARFVLWLKKAHIAANYKDKHQ